MLQTESLNIFDEDKKSDHQTVNTISTIDELIDVVEQYGTLRTIKRHVSPFTFQPLCLCCDRTNTYYYEFTYDLIHRNLETIIDKKLVYNY